MEKLKAALDDRYRIEEQIGEGGMATVYLAEDLKHDRQVAIKVLKPELAAVIGGERFVAEIKTTAALQHPHILPLFDSGTADGFLYYVMPYVVGESLREKLDREKQLPVEEAAKVAAAVASALHYAHERGLVHRDIKPANILLHAGEPVVSDFGIALAISAAGGGRLTETGMSVGTPHYMSPEQASADRDVGPRSDIYSLASVLYEMLTGAPPHTGANAQVVLMRVLTEEPRDVSEVRKAVPDHLRGALMKALEKLPADRFGTAEEFKRALIDEGFRYRTRTGSGPDVGVTGTGSVSGRSWFGDRRSRVLVGANLILLASLGWALSRFGGESTGVLSGTGPVHRYEVGDSLRDIGFPAVSSKGDVAYAGAVDDRYHLRLKRASDPIPREIEGTDGAMTPVFSPEGDWLAFKTEAGGIKKVQLESGAVMNVLREGWGPPMFFLSQWTSGGDILLASSDGIYRVPDEGGDPSRIHEAGPSVSAHLLPDERTLLYTEALEGEMGATKVVGVDLVTGDTFTIAQDGTNARWSPTGHIVYGHRSGALFALPFDLSGREVTGSPISLEESVFNFLVYSHFAISPTGSLVYLASGESNVEGNGYSLAWLDMSGETTPIALEPTDHPDARLSPDGGRIAYTRGGQIHLFGVATETDQPFTFEGDDHHDPVWSPDGMRLAFASNRREGGEAFDVFLKDADGRSPAVRLAGGNVQNYPSDWLEDGTIVAYDRAGPVEETDIWMFRTAGTGAEPTYLLLGDLLEGAGRVSPDGRWMAYLAGEVGSTQVLVREFPSMAGPWQVSEGMVTSNPLWSRDGSALFYQRNLAEVIRVNLELEPTFRTVGETILPNPGGFQVMDLDQDGQRFLAVRSEAIKAVEGAQPGLVVVPNWLTELREQLGEGEGR